ncbi:hypothetical protein FKM82_029922 [Ascaphus truei]
MRCITVCVSAPACTLGRVSRRSWGELHGAQIIIRCITFCVSAPICTLGRVSRMSWGQLHGAQIKMRCITSCISLILFFNLLFAQNNPPYLKCHKSNISRQK